MLSAVITVATPRVEIRTVKILYVPGRTGRYTRYTGFRVRVAHDNIIIIIIEVFRRSVGNAPREVHIRSTCDEHLFNARRAVHRNRTLHKNISHLYGENIFRKTPIWWLSKYFKKSRKELGSM